MVATRRKQIRALVIVGPTASGKSALAMRIAERFQGEIIAADSRTIYKFMDAGTAKPDNSDLKKVPHWGLDLVELDRPFSAAQFKAYATSAMADVLSRNKLPILVGGTGLYIDTVGFDFRFPRSSDKELRKTLEGKSLKELHRQIDLKGIPMPENWKNPRHLIRAIELGGSQGTRSESPAKGIVYVGLWPDSHRLKENIAKRARSYLTRGLIKETRLLIDKYGKDILNEKGGIAYKAAMSLLDGNITEEEFIELVRTKEWQYAKRQMTWFKRNKFIHWYSDVDIAFTSVSAMLDH